MNQKDLKNIDNKNIIFSNNKNHSRLYSQKKTRG